VTDNPYRPKWWYWVIAILGLLWSLPSVADFVLTVSKNEAYLSQVPPDVMEVYLSFPTWLMGVWALAVFAGLFGWILLLTTSRHAPLAFIVSLIALIINFGYMMVTGGFKILGSENHIMMGMIIVISLFAIWFSRKMTVTGILN